MSERWPPTDQDRWCWVAAELRLRGGGGLRDCHEGCGWTAEPDEECPRCFGTGREPTAWSPQLDVQCDACGCERRLLRHEKRPPEAQCRCGGALSAVREVAYEESLRDAVRVVDDLIAREWARRSGAANTAVDELEAAE
jgi:hypothetical protein